MGNERKGRLAQDGAVREGFIEGMHMCWVIKTGKI